MIVVALRAHEAQAILLHSEALGGGGVDAVQGRVDVACASVVNTGRRHDSLLVVPLVLWSAWWVQLLPLASRFRSRVRGDGTPTTPVPHALASLQRLVSLGCVDAVLADVDDAGYHRSNQRHHSLVGTTTPHRRTIDLGQHSPFSWCREALDALALWAARVRKALHVHAAPLHRHCPCAVDWVVLVDRACTHPLLALGVAQDQHECVGLAWRRHNVKGTTATAFRQPEAVVLGRCVWIFVGVFPCKHKRDVLR